MSEFGVQGYEEFGVGVIEFPRKEPLVQRGEEWFGYLERR
jgi:hypothetical protein